MISNSLSGNWGLLQTRYHHKPKILLSKEQETQNSELLTNHPLLKCFEIHNTGVYLGAHIQPGAPNSYAHIQKRMAKAHIAISAMNLRGFKIRTIGRKTTNKVITSIIIPILTYGLESFPMSDLNYKYLGQFCLKNLTQLPGLTSPNQNKLEMNLP